MSSLGKDQVHLWIVRDAVTLDPANAAAYAALLSADEKVRWQRFVFPADRQRFLLARVLVRSVLAQALEQADPAALQFVVNAYGKPALRTSATKPPLHFNLTHTDGLLVLAVNKTLELGVDAEWVRRKVDMLALSERYFATSEHQALLDLAGTAQRERFFALWTLKEAYVKARGLGLKIPLDAFSFTFDDHEPVLSFSPQLDDQAAHWHCHLLSFAGEFKIALALRLAGALLPALTVHELDPLQLLLP